MLDEAIKESQDQLKHLPDSKDGLEEYIQKEALNPGQINTGLGMEKTLITDEGDYRVELNTENELVVMTPKKH